jgi:hypothetical protein
MNAHQSYTFVIILLNPIHVSQLAGVGHDAKAVLVVHMMDVYMMDVLRVSSDAGLDYLPHKQKHSSLLFLGK